MKLLYNWILLSATVVPIVNIWFLDFSFLPRFADSFLVS